MNFKAYVIGLLLAILTVVVFNLDHLEAFIVVFTFCTVGLLWT